MQTDWWLHHVLHEKTYFTNHGKLKIQVNIIFPSTLWLKKRPYFHHRKFQRKSFLVQNKNFSVSSIYRLCIYFFTQKKTIFLITEKLKTIIFHSVISKYYLFMKFLIQKWPCFPSPKSSKQRPFGTKEELFSNQ